SIKAREIVDVNNNELYAYTGSLSKQTDPFQRLYETPSLVEYKKIGEWKFYPEATLANSNNKEDYRNFNMSLDYVHYAQEWKTALQRYSAFNQDLNFDSIKVVYNNNYIKEFIGYSNTNFKHYVVEY